MLSNKITIGDLVRISVAVYEKRSHIEASTNQGSATLPRSQNGLYWYYRYVRLIHKKPRHSTNAIVVDSAVLGDGRKIFVCLSPNGEFKPFVETELSLIIKGNCDES